MGSVSVKLLNNDGSGRKLLNVGEGCDGGAEIKLLNVGRSRGGGGGWKLLNIGAVGGGDNPPLLSSPLFLLKFLLLFFTLFNLFYMA